MRQMILAFTLLSAAATAHLDHYSGRFITAGWKKVEEQSASSIGVMTFEITSRGTPWHCTFIVSIPASDADDVQLILRMK